MLTRVLDEVAFGLENIGAPPGGDPPRARTPRSPPSAPDTSQAASSPSSRAASCSASASRRRSRSSRSCCSLDEPTSQLDPHGARRSSITSRSAADRGAHRGAAAARVPAVCDRCCSSSTAASSSTRRPRRADGWLGGHRPGLARGSEHGRPGEPCEVVCRFAGAVRLRRRRPALDDVARAAEGQIVALVGPNGAGRRHSRSSPPACSRRRRARRSASAARPTCSQDPGRYLVRERVHEEVALGVGGDRARAPGALADVGLAGLEDRHPRDLSSGERERAGARGRARDRARSARARRADARRRPGAEARARGADRRRSASARRSSSRTTSRFARAVADSIVSLDSAGARPLPRLVLSLAAAAAFAAAVWAPSSPHDRRSRCCSSRRRSSSRSCLVGVGPSIVASRSSLVATLGAAAAAGRVLFAAIPGVQPVTVICVASGAALGAAQPVSRSADRRVRLELLPRPGIVDALADARLGGLRRGGRARGTVPARADRLCRRLRRPRLRLQRLMDVWTWLAFYDQHTWRHSPRRTDGACGSTWPTPAGNVALALAAGPELRRMLDRYGRRLQTEIAWA